MTRLIYYVGTILLSLSFLSLALSQYCSARLGGCCPGRDDLCHMVFHDTLCYCDEFCQRSNSDCCPDYYGGFCNWNFTTIPKVTPGEIGSTAGCHFNGQEYDIGETVIDNCNLCTCQVNDLFQSVDFVCETEPCAIEPVSVIDINSRKIGWVAGNYSDFWGKTLKVVRIYKTGTLPPIGVVAEQTEVDIELIDRLPQNFDVREKWVGLIGDIQDQGDCGSSWAASTIALASDRLAIQSGGQVVHRLSMQHLLSCNIRRQQGCNGGYTDRAYWYLRKSGVVTEECYPLESGQDKYTKMDKLPCQLGNGESYPCPTRSATSDLNKSTPPYRISMNQEEIMYEIFQNGPVQATFLVKEDFFSYLTGVYRYSGISSDHDEYHSVRIFGWGTDFDDEGNELPYWMCANSWGNTWGEDGFFRIRRGINECEIESFVIGVWGQVDANVNNL